MNPLRISVDPELLEASKFGAGAVVRVERSSSLGGTYVEVGTAPLVANTLVVEFDDATGADGDWYRTRYSKATPATAPDYSPYSAEWQFTSAPSAYATVEDFTDTYEVAPLAGRVRRIASVLEEASAQLTAAIGWDFYRHPASSGTEQRTLDVRRSTSRLCVHEGIVSLSLVEYRGGPSDSWTGLTTSDWYLDPRTATPAGHVALTGTAIAAWPKGVSTVRLTGVFGYATVPADVRRATVALARQIYRADATTAGGGYGPDELAGGIAPSAGMWPRDAYEAAKRYRELYLGCFI